MYNPYKLILKETKNYFVIRKPSNVLVQIGNKRYSIDEQIEFNKIKKLYKKYKKLNIFAYDIKNKLDKIKDYKSIYYSVYEFNYKNDFTLKGIFNYNRNLLSFLKKYKYSKLVFDDGMEILYNQDSVTFLNKNNKYSIQNFIKDNKQYNFIRNFYYEYGICNRLDYETSGIVLCAKNVDTYEKFRATINSKDTYKIYITLVNGLIEKDYFETNMTFKKEMLTINNKLKLYYQKVIDIKGIYKTIFKKIKTYKYNSKYYTLLSVRIFNGQQHQIRVSLQHIGYPIVSDDKYSLIYEYYNKKKLYSTLEDNKLFCPRLFLHSIFYKIDNDEIYCGLTEDLINVLKRLKYPVFKIL